MVVDLVKYAVRLCHDIRHTLVTSEAVASLADHR